jgi:hypothetical protein
MKVRNVERRQLMNQPSSAALSAAAHHAEAALGQSPESALELAPGEFAPSEAAAESAAVESPRELNEMDLTSPFFTARYEELSPDQETAMEALRRGGTIAEAARAADVARMTVYRWMKKDPNFRAIYHQWQDEVRQSARARLMSLTYKAITAVQKCIEDGDGKLALQLLKQLGALFPAEPWPVQLAMTDPILVERMDALRMRQLAEAMEIEEGRLARRKKDSTAGVDSTGSVVSPRAGS